MKMSKVFLFVWIFWVLGVAQAYALGTAANTTVSNTATANFSVAGQTQSPVTSPPVVFVVDLKVTFTVLALDASYVPVGPSATSGQPLKFKVTNNSNDVMDFPLSYTQDTTGATDPFGTGTDGFNTTNVLFYKDNGNGTFGAEDGAPITFLDDILADGSATVFVVSDMPSPLPASGQISSGTLTAVAHKGGAVGLGSIHVQTSGPDDPTVVDTVFADDAGDTDVARDGKHSDDAAYKVYTPTLAVIKIFTIISDPSNGATNPKAIPGAIVEYCIQIKNEGNVTADNIVMTDTIPTGSTFISGTIVAGGTAQATTTCNVNSGTPEDDDTADGDDVLSSAQNTGSFNSTSKVVRTEVLNLLPAATITSRFRVTINP